MHSTIDLNYWLGVILITLIVGLLNFFGKELIEKFKTIGTMLLMIGYLVFSLMVIISTYNEALEVFTVQDTSFIDENFSIWTVLWSGILYVGYSLVIYPSALFAVRRQKSRKESVISGLIAGVLMTVPWFLTYVSILGFYPSSQVLNASIPWLEMLNQISPSIVIIFGVVVGWTLIETATGMIHAFIDRVDSQVKEHFNKSLSSFPKGIIAISTLIVAVILSQVGIVDLISKGYTAMSYAMIVIFGIPLLTVGLYKAFFKKKKEKSNRLTRVI